MFTGLVSELGVVSGIERDEQGATLRVSAALSGQLQRGRLGGRQRRVPDGDRHRLRRASARRRCCETLQGSALGTLQEGSRVNLELPLRAGDRLGGHVVQGHVDGTATVRAVREEGFSRVLELECPAALLRYVVLEGLGGARRRQPHRQRPGGRRLLGLADPRDDLARTTLGALREGDLVNVEVDVLAKHLERLMAVRA